MSMQRLLYYTTKPCFLLKQLALWGAVVMCVAPQTLLLFFLSFTYSKPCIYDLLCPRFNTFALPRFVSLISFTGMRFSSLHSSCQCNSWEEGTPLHQTPIKAHFNEGKLITALVTDAGWSASDANLCFCHPAGHNRSDRKISDGMRRGVEGCAEFRR